MQTLHTTLALAEDILHLVQTLTQTNSHGNDPSQQGDEYGVKIKIQNACDALLRKILGPLEYTAILAASCQESQALYFVTTLGVPDFIGDGTETLTQLSEKTAVSPRALNVAMSCLLGCGYFEEVGGFGAREYRNNAFSDILKRDHPSSMADAVGFVGDEGFRAASRLLDSAKIRKDENGQVVKSLPAVNLAFGFQEPIFEWMSKPEEAWRGQRLGKAMQQLHRMSNGNVGIDYPWSTLTSPIIDVGGGIGSLELALLEDQRNIHLKFVIFDIPNTTENAAKLWSTQSTSMLSRVSFMAGDFLAPIPSDTNIPKGQPTYVVRHVLHDWTDDEVVTILSNVRNAMATNSLLLICDMLLQANSSRFVRATSMQLLALNNGITRTEGDMIHLLEKAGFSVRKVHKMRAVDSIIEAVIT